MSEIEQAASVKKRRDTIVSLVNERGYITIEDLSAMMDASQVTLRTDLKELDNQGLLIRLRGVALAARYNEGDVSRTQGESRALQMSQRMIEEKRVIARLCQQLFQPSDTVFLDNSNTNYLVAEEMVVQRDKQLTVVTNSLDIINILRYGPHIQAVLTGGDYDSTTNSLVGSLATGFLANFYAHCAVLTARGFDSRRGVRVYHGHNTSVRRAMLQNAGTCVVVADHSKFSIQGVESLCGWDEVDILVTDQTLPSPYAEIAQKHGIRVISPEAEEEVSRKEETR